MVGLGQNVVCGCGVSKESSVEVWPVTTPTPQLPIAAKVTLVPRYVINPFLIQCGMFSSMSLYREKLGFSVEASFTNYLLHMYGKYIPSPSLLPPPSSVIMSTSIPTSTCRGMSSDYVQLPQCAISWREEGFQGPDYRGPS